MRTLWGSLFFIKRKEVALEKGYRKKNNRFI
nr:MAG TPA: hypothetical protein [Caudoviricetes sp.]